ncbi:hypothetical protein E2C01_054311 [Portunus trituberculatus]|uniref:Uncharacterized protein n=1 Tax=Portunus trituberculatus TaxID=210409 RepID=A0A5B7GN53_PORTR|nr:hypothetical protein [Portunus trituberculatus]
MFRQLCEGSYEADPSRDSALVTCSAHMLAVICELWPPETRTHSQTFRSFMSITFNKLQSKLFEFPRIFL